MLKNKNKKWFCELEVELAPLIKDKKNDYADTIVSAKV